MKKQERAKLIKMYGAGYEEVLGALEEFPASKLTARPFRGKWSAAEIVHHLADSEMTAAIRLRRLLVEDRPVIYGYDQDAFADRLRYNEREVEPALDAFRAARATTMQLLEAMTLADWARQAWHTDGGAYDPERWLEIYGVHAHNHAAQIARLRAAVTSKAGATKRKPGSGR
jgi:DinB superfamily